MTARTELEVARELKSVRKMLAKWRKAGEDEDLLYGAQQALLWVLKRGMSPTELEGAIQELAQEFWKLDHG